MKDEINKIQSTYAMMLENKQSVEDQIERERALKMDFMRKCVELEDKALKIAEDHKHCATRALSLALKKLIWEKRIKEYEA